MNEIIGFRPLAPDSQPDNDAPDYLTTRKRHPRLAPIAFPHTITEATGPSFSPRHFPPMADLSIVDGQRALGERIVVAGRITDENGRPVPNTMIEIWQANASGRYQHPGDQHDAPIDTNFVGSGRVFTNDEGRYSFITVQPGAYPWPNHHNAWRPRHIHFSYFGGGFASRLITQMYFPGDPLLEFDPIYKAVPAGARERLVSALDLAITQPDTALGYRFDVVLRGRAATPMEDHA